MVIGIDYCSMNGQYIGMDFDMNISINNHIISKVVTILNTWE